MQTPIVVGYVGKPYLEFIQWLKGEGFEIHLFHDAKQPIRGEEGLTDLIMTVHRLDFANQNTFLKQLEQISVVPEFFVSVFENAVVPKTWLTEKYSLPGISLKAAERATDKSLMRKAFSASCPEYTAYFKTITSWQDIESAISDSTFQFPLILKPTNLFKSLLVTKSNNVSELKKNFDDSLNLIQSIYANEYVARTPSFVLEEYLDGPSYSLEVFADGDGKMVSAPSPVDLIMGKDLEIDDNYNYSRKLPTTLSTSQQSELREAAFAGVKALEILNSPAHVEMVYTKKGPKIIEIGARTGGYRARMHKLADGVNLFQAQVDVAQGKLPNLAPQKASYCAVYELFPLAKGKFQEITNINQVLQSSTLYYSFVPAKSGELVGPSKDGFRFSGLFIFASEDKETFKKETAFFEDQAKVLTVLE
ncbi:MAG: ATP-grasp domain-containing protein [Microgenomates group bacterium]